MSGNRVLVLCAVLSLVLTACGGGSVSRGMHVKNLGKEKIVNTSGNKPDWTFQKPMFVDNGVLYVSGMFTDAPNLGKGLHLADTLARAKVAKMLRDRLQDDMNYASEGLDVDSTVFERILTSSTDEIVLNGIFQNSQYYEKKQVITLSGTVYRYDCFALIEMPQERYLAMLDNIMKEQSGKGGVSDTFREKIEARQREFFKNLSDVKVEEKLPKDKLAAETLGLENEKTLTQ